MTPKKIVDLAIETYGECNVVLNPKLDGVRVPSRFLDQEQMQLIIGHDLPNPIRDLAFDEEGFSGTLSFDGAPFFCKVPWSAVIGVIAGTKGSEPPDVVVSFMYAKSNRVVDLAKTTKLKLV